MKPAAIETAAIIQHYLMRAVWCVLPVRAKVAIWKYHRKNLKPTRFARQGA